MPPHGSGSDAPAHRRVGRVTIVEIAQRAGVHASTVSRALNPQTQHRISSDVVDRIVDVAESMGYRRNTMASALRTQKSHAIGVMVSNMSDPVHPPIVRAIEDAVAERGYVTLIGNTDNNVRREETILTRLISQGVDGLIIASFKLHDKLVELCLDAGVPTVAVFRDPEDPRISSAIVDDVGAMEIAVAHLAALGHRDIVHLAGPQNLSTGRNRARGFRHAYEALIDAEDRPRIYVSDRYTIEEGERLAERLVVEGVPTGVVAANDMLAIGCISGLRRHGIDCPARVSIVGMNDMPLVGMLDPPLTTVRTPSRQLGEEAAQLLFKAMDDPAASAVRVALKPELITRKSTSPV